MSFGIDDRYEYKEYVFDSLDSDNVRGGSSTTDWPLFTIGVPLPNVVGMKILEVIIPFSYYVINSSNNTFTLTETVGAVSQTVTLAVGNYNSTSILTALNTSLDAASVAGGNSFTYTSSFSTVTNKLSISKTGAGEFAFVFGTSTDTGETNPRLWLGFNAGTSTSSSSLLTASIVLGITGPDYLYINSTSHGQYVSMYLPQTFGVSATGIGNEMAKIPVNVNPGGVITWTDPCPELWYKVDLASFGTIDFYLQMGNTTVKPLSLNGRPFQIKLGLLLAVNDQITIQSGATHGGVTKRFRLA